MVELKISPKTLGEITPANLPFRFGSTFFETNCCFNSRNVAKSKTNGEVNKLLWFT